LIEVEQMRMIDSATVDRAMSWPRMMDALRAGHRAPKPQFSDIYLSEANTGLLTRAAWITGLGSLVKAVSVFPANVTRTPPLPSIQGTVLLMTPDTGSVRAIIDGAAVTRWKTAGDSAFGSSLLSRPDARALTMVGAGVMAEPLIRAHVAVRPSIETITIWNRSAERAQALAMRLGDLHRIVAVSEDLESAVRCADVVSCATMSTEPLVLGAWLKPGAHLDLVGAYTKSMREADDAAVRRARVFVDFRGTAVHDIGELNGPLERGVIAEADVLADLYDLVGGAAGRTSAAEMTLYKNGGGAHLDLMTSLAIVEAVEAAAA
jgi:ornithine cyclodeaminase/alanine dehydrogenase-like protein (mu-crystallin family)